MKMEEETSCVRTSMSFLTIHDSKFEEKTSLYMAFSWSMQY